MGQDRIELGYQTTKRGIVWYRNGLPKHNPAWRLSRDTNAVIWCDTFTTLRYWWSYKDDKWVTDGVLTSTLPPLPTQTSGSATIDNRQATWVPANNIRHRFDVNQTAWVPIGDWFYLANAPSNVSAGGSNGAAVYTTSLWQDSDDHIVRYWDGDSWEPFGGAGGGIYGDGTAGSGDDNLPPGGSTVTTNNDPLQFQTATAAGLISNVIQVLVPYSSDDAFTNYLAGYTPIDSFKIFNFDGGTYARTYSGDFNIESDDQILLTADSVRVSTVASSAKVPALVGINAQGTLKQITASTNDHVLKWSNGGWVTGAVPGGGGGSGITSINTLTASAQSLVTGTSGTDFNINSATATHTFNLPTASATNRGALSSTDWSTFNSKVGGTGTSNYVAYWTGASTIAADADFQFDGTRVGIQGAPVSGFSLYTANAVRFDGTAVIRGSGDNFTGNTATPHFRLWNTTASTGDTWYIGSENDGELSITSSNLGGIQAKFTANGDYQLTNALEMKVDAAPPSAPTDGLSLYTEERGLQFPAWVDEAGQTWEVSPGMVGSKWGTFNPVGNGTSISVVGINSNASGTATTRNVASTNLFTSTRRIGYTTGTTTNTAAGNRHNLQQFFRGNAANIGGFYFACRFGFSTADAANKSAFIGLIGQTTQITGGTNPSSLTNLIGVGIDAGQTTLRFIRNDASGTATTTDLGANFPSNQIDNTLYDLRIYAKPNAGNVYYWLKNLSTGNVTSGTVSTDLPAGTQLLCPQIHVSNGASATSVGIDIVQYYIITNY